MYQAYHRSARGFEDINRCDDKVYVKHCCSGDICKRQRSTTSDSEVLIGGVVVVVVVVVIYAVAPFKTKTGDCPETSRSDEVVRYDSAKKEQ